MLMVSYSGLDFMTSWKDNNSLININAGDSFVDYPILSGCLVLSGTPEDVDQLISCIENFKYNLDSSRSVILDEIGDYLLEDKITLESGYFNQELLDEPEQEEYNLYDELDSWLDDYESTETSKKIYVYIEGNFRDFYWNSEEKCTNRDFDLSEDFGGVYYIELRDAEL